jgi:hypothetical protein
MIDNLNDEVVLEEDSKEAPSMVDEEKPLKDECPRYECLERERLISEQAKKIKSLEQRVDGLELKLMSKRGKIALLKM